MSFFGVEILKRQEGRPTQKEQIDGNFQVSFNSYGHLVLRFFKGDFEDRLIVLSAPATEKVKDFIINYLGENKKVINLNIQHAHFEKEGIPF